MLQSGSAAFFSLCFTPPPPLSVWPHVAFLLRQMIVRLPYNHMCTCSCTPKVWSDNKSCPEGTFCQSALSARGVSQKTMFMHNKRKTHVQIKWDKVLEPIRSSQIQICCQQIDSVGFYRELHEETFFPSVCIVVHDLFSYNVWGNSKLMWESLFPDIKHFSNMNVIETLWCQNQLHCVFFQCSGSQTVAQTPVTVQGKVCVYVWKIAIK